MGPSNPERISSAPTPEWIVEVRLIVKSEDPDYPKEVVMDAIEAAVNGFPSIVEGYVRNVRESRV